MSIEGPSPLRSEPVTQAQLDYYASASGDFNRIHLDPAYAREAGHPGTLVHGMLTMGLLGRLLTRWAGPGSVKKLSARFLGVTYVGDVITCEARVVEERDEGIVVLELTASRSDGTKTAAGSAEVVRPRAARA